MQYQTLGSSGIEVSRVVMGTWQAGKTGFKGQSQWVGIDDSSIAATLETALDCGVNTFDTALIYGEGESEKILGRVLGARRDTVVWASKTHPLQLAYDQIINACHRSLNNLGTDYLDLYQIHFPSGALGPKKVPMEETMKAMNQLKKEGKIRAIGVSNHSVDELKEVMTFSDIDCVQPPYSLLWRQAEDALIPYCERHGISVWAYSPLAQGLLTGRSLSADMLEEGDNRRHNILFKEPHLSRVQEMMEEVNKMAEVHQISATQLALAWVMRRPRFHAITGVRQPDQLSRNVQSVGLQLSEDLWQQLDELSDRTVQHWATEPMMWKHG